MAVAPTQYRVHVDRKRGWPARNKTSVSLETRDWLQWQQIRDAPARSQQRSTTWPFCTRFMLKPTVGMVLYTRPVSLALAISCKRRSEAAHSAVNSPPCCLLVEVFCRTQRSARTARTRTRVVLPLFCRPQMATSISVRQKKPSSQSSRRRIRAAMASSDYRMFSGDSTSCSRDECRRQMSISDSRRKRVCDDDDKHRCCLGCTRRHTYVTLRRGADWLGGLAQSLTEVSHKVDEMQHHHQ